MAQRRWYLLEQENEKEISIADLVTEKLALLKGTDLYALLGIEKGSDSTQIRDAYFSLAKILHPDAISRINDKDLADKALDVFKAVSKAYQILSDKMSRTLYEQEGVEAVLQNSRTGTKKRDKAAEARIFFHKGKLFMQRRAYLEAARCFEKCVKLDPESGGYKAHLGWAIMQDDKVPQNRRLEEAKKWFESAIEAATNQHEPYYFMSLYHKAVGNVEKQRACLQDALTINPNHTESKREARLLLMRSRKSHSGLNNLVSQVKAALNKLQKK